MYSKEALRNQESKIMVAQGQYKEIEKMLEDFDRKAEQNTAYFAKLTSDIEGERLTISSTNEEIVKLEGQISVLKTNIEHNNEDSIRLNEEKEALSRSDSDALAEIEQKKADAQSLENDKIELENKL